MSLHPALSSVAPGCLSAVGGFTFRFVFSLCLGIYYADTLNCLSSYICSAPTFPKAVLS